MSTTFAAERIGRYQLLEPIGVGCSGAVSRAKVFGVAGFERQFAVKRFSIELTQSAAMAQALSAAARAYGSLEHPRIARMSEFGVAGGVTFTAVELVPGLDVLRLLSEAKLAGATLAPGGTLTLVSQTARAVGYAHGRGLSHLGLAPTNVIVTPDGDVKITDFGILAATLPARPVDVARLANRIAYLAPEQIAGEATSAATDVFALGVIAYELVTGHRAYSGATPAAIAAAITSGPPPEPQLPRPIVRVLQRCLARSPFERFPDARALADALDAALRVAPVPGTRKDIGAQVQETMDRLAALNDGGASGMVALHVGTGPMRKVSIHDAPTTDFDRVEPEPPPMPFGSTPPQTVPLPSASTTMPEMIRAPLVTMPGLAPPPIPVPQGVAPNPAAPPPIPSSTGVPPGTLLGIPPMKAPPSIGGKSAIPSVRPAVPPRPPVVPLVPPVPSSGAAPPPTPINPRPPTQPPMPPSMMAPVVVPPRVVPPPASRAPSSAETIVNPEPTVESRPATAIETRGPTTTGEDDLERALELDADFATSPGIVPPRRPTTTTSQVVANLSTRGTGEIAPLATVMPRAASSPGLKNGEPDTDYTPLPAPEPMAPRDSQTDVLPLPAPRLTPLPTGLRPSTSPPPLAPAPIEPPIVRAPDEPYISHAPIPEEPKRSKVPWLVAGVVGLGLLGFIGYEVYDVMTEETPTIPSKKVALPTVAIDASAQVIPESPADAALVGVAKQPDAGVAKAVPPDAAIAIDAEAIAKTSPPDAAAPSTPDAATTAIVAPPNAGSKDSLLIDSTPHGAHVFLDGSDVGVTPAKLPGTADRHNISLLLAGHDLYVAQVDGHGTFTIPLKEITPPGGPAGIKVIKCKEANRYYVFVDGKPTGMMCPTERIETTVGSHTVEVYDAGTEQRRKFDIVVADTRLSYRVRIDN